MPTVADSENLTPDELARVQAAIDAGTIWTSVSGGRFAMRLIDAKKCSLAPGVVTMWLGDDDLYRPIYSQAEAAALRSELLKTLPGTLAAVKRSGQEVEFLTKHHDELVRIETDAVLSPKGIDPWIPAVLFGGGAAVVCWLASVSLWFAASVGAMAFLIQRRSGERLQAETLAKVNALRASEGLSPKEDSSVHSTH